MFPCGNRAEPRAGSCHSSSEHEGGKTREGVKCWHGLPRSGVDAPCLETSRVRLRALSNPTQLKMSLLLVGWLDQRTLRKSLSSHTILSFLGSGSRAAGRGHVPLSLCCGAVAPSSNRRSSQDPCSGTDLELGLG